MKTELSKIAQDLEKGTIDETEAQDLLLGLLGVGKSVYLTEKQIDELAQIASQHLYLDASDEGRISHGGIIEILTKYEELRETNNNKHER